MSGQNPPPDPPYGDDDRSDEDAQAEQAARRQQSAQSAAADLARMGIDPRSLGLGDTAPTAQPGPPTISARADDPSAQVLPLRPGLDHRIAPATRDVGAAPQSADDPGYLAGPTRVGSPRAPWAPAEPPPSRPVGVVEEMIARTATRKPAPRSPSRLVRAVTLGLVTPDAAEAAGVERELVAALRHRQTERRVVTFISGKGGVGTTTIAAGVGSAFAALRDDSTVLVDIQPGTLPLGQLQRVEYPTSARAVLASTETSEVARTSSGLGVVDGPGWDESLEREDVIGLLDRLGAENAFNLIDAGDYTGEAAHAALARCDQVVIVTNVGELGMGALNVAASRVRQVNPAAAESAVYAIVCQHEESYRRAHREVTSQLSRSPARIVVVPSDETLRNGQPFDPALVSAATRESVIEIGAAIAVSGGRP